MTQRNLRGAYYCPTHDYKEDWDWLAAWQPNVIRLMLEGKPEDPNSLDVNRVKRVHDTCPDATLLLRCWDVDDRNFAAHDEMVKDPHGEAERQVNWWAKVFDNAVAAGVPRGKLMAGLNNETGPDKDGSLYPYTERALELGTQRGVRLGVFVFSVGRPGLQGESQFDIPYFSKLDAAIVANRGAIVLHQYMQPEGMYAVWTDNEGKERKDWTYLMGRDTRWQVKSDIIIGEWGLNGLLYNRHPDPKYGDSGWTNFKEWPPSRYADEYVECIRQASPNVIGICPYIEDWKDHKWQSFDLRSAYGEFLARKDKCVKEVGETVHLPAIDNGPSAPATVAYVLPTAGANLRDFPEAGNVIIAIPYGEQVTITGYDVASKWMRAEYRGKVGWVHPSLLGVMPPNSEKNAPPEPPGGDKWQRTIAFILGEEGGYTANDEGNPANFGINQGANPDLDVAHITREQAIERYRTGYYIASGADKLGWPFCLLVTDAAVQHGVEEAKDLLRQSGGNILLFQGLRQLFYGQIKEDSWQRNGRGWMNRTGRLLVEASKA